MKRSYKTCRNKYFLIGYEIHFIITKFEIEIIGTNAFRTVIVTVRNGIH